MRKNWVLNIQLILIIGIVIFLYNFAFHRNEKRKISTLDIEIIEDNTPLLTTEVVNNLLKEKVGKPFVLAKEDLDLNAIEKLINNHKLVDSSEVFVSVSGKLKAIVTQKVPIARVFDSNYSYYVDYNGEEMPLSNNYSARVPLLHGNINNPYSKEIVGLLRLIHNDDFLRKNIIGMQIKPDGNIIMRNRNYSYEIFFGRTLFMERKLNNYKAFFQKAVQDTILDSYKTINLKFIKQVVCTK